MGSFGSPCFYFLELNCKFFKFSAISSRKILATPEQIGYNARVYASTPLHSISTASNERK
jgi:hypothetical protein